MQALDSEKDGLRFSHLAPQVGLESTTLRRTSMGLTSDDSSVAQNCATLLISNSLLRQSGAGEFAGTTHDYPSFLTCLPARNQSGKNMANSCRQDKQTQAVFPGVAPGWSFTVVKRSV
jgi:hypothetical protein